MKTLEEQVRDHLIKAISVCGGGRTEASHHLGIKPSYVWELSNILRIEPYEYYKAEPQEILSMKEMKRQAILKAIDEYKEQDAILKVLKLPLGTFSGYINSLNIPFELQPKKKRSYIKQCDRPQPIKEPEEPKVDGNLFYKIISDYGMMYNFKRRCFMQDHEKAGDFITQYRKAEPEFKFLQLSVDFCSLVPA